MLYSLKSRRTVLFVATAAGLLTIFQNCSPAQYSALAPTLGNSATVQIASVAQLHQVVGQSSPLPAVVTPASPSSATTVAPVVPFQPAMGISGIKYWGFWGSALDGAGTGNYIPQVSANLGNTVMIREADPIKLKLKLKEAKALNLNVILYLENILFPWASSYAYPDWQDRFLAHWKDVGEYQSIVVGFYIADEMFEKNTLPGWASIDPSSLRDTLNAFANWLEIILPHHLTYMTFTHKEVSSPSFAGLNPTSIDVIGFNCYLAFPECSETYIQILMGKLQAGKTARQKIIMTADGYWGSTPDFGVDMKILERLRFWRGLSATIPDVVAYFPFIYQNVPSENLYGMNGMPNSLGENSIHFGALSGLLTCSSNDLIVNNRQGQTIGVWFQAPICVPKCEGHDYVRRTVLGALADVWASAPLCQ